MRGDGVCESVASFLALAFWLWLWIGIWLMLFFSESFVFPLEYLVLRPRAGCGRKVAVRYVPGTVEFDAGVETSSQQVRNEKHRLSV